MSGHDSISEAKPATVRLHREQMAAMSGLHRAANAVRQHLENSVLRNSELTWTGFVVLWVVWTAGELETRRAAEEAGISKGTLTGVAKTLQTRGLIERLPHPTDGRLAILRTTRQGEKLMNDLLPKYSEEEAFVADPLATTEAKALADMLRRMVSHLEANGEQRRTDLRGGTVPPPRRSGRRPKQT